MQDYKSHKRFVPLFHFVLFGLILIAFFASVFNFLSHGEGEFLQSVIMMLFSIILIFLFFFCRIFALKAQNRAIRAEENLRHFILTGKALDKKLTMGQIIALRFAPDEEFTNLAKTTVEKDLSPDEIKRSIKNWKPDQHRA